MDDDDEQDLQLAPRSRQDEDYSIPEYARPTQAEELPPFVQRARQPAPAAEELPPFVQRAQQQQQQAPAELPPFVQQQQQAQPEAEGMIGTAAREAAHGIVPMLGTIAGGAAGAVGGLPGMIAGGVAGGAGAQYLQEKALNALGFDDSHQRAVNAKEHPYAAIVGEAAPVLPFFGAGAVPKAARVVGGAVVGGLEGARQLYEGEFDPLRLATSTATGAALAKPTALTRGIESRVGAVLGREAVSRPGFPAEGAPDTAAAREEVQPAGQPAGPKVSRGTAEEAPPPQEQKVGDVQNAAVGSERNYPAAPRTPEAGALEGRLMTPSEISTARSGINVAPQGEGIADPALRAALGSAQPRTPAEIQRSEGIPYGEAARKAQAEGWQPSVPLRAALGGAEAMPAEDRAMLLGQRQQGPGPGDIEPRARTAERPADVLRGPAAERPAAPPIPPGLEALVARNPRMAEYLANRYPELETMQRQARPPEMQFQQQEQPPPLSQPARDFVARMQAQRAAQQGGMPSPTGGGRLPPGEPPQQPPRAGGEPPVLPQKDALGTANVVHDRLDLLRRQRDADLPDVLNQIRAAQKEAGMPVMGRVRETATNFMRLLRPRNEASERRLYRAVEDQDVSRLTPQERAYKDAVDKKFDPEIKEHLDWFQKNKLMDQIPAIGGHIRRLVKGFQGDAPTMVGEDPIIGTYRGGKPSALQDQVFHGITAKDGEHHVIVQMPNGAFQVHQQGKAPAYIENPYAGEKPGQLYGKTLDLNGKEFTIGRTRARDIEARVPGVQYHETYSVAKASQVMQLREYRREAEFFKQFKGDDPAFNSVRSSSPKTTPAGEPFVRTDIPGLSHLWLHPRVAQAFDRVYKTDPYADTLIGKLNNILVSSIFLNPVPHSMNEVFHWVVGRGEDWIKPRGIADLFNTGSKALTAVLQKNQDYVDFLNARGPMVNAGRNRQNAMFQIANLVGADMKQAPHEWDIIARKLGTGPGELVRSIFDASASAMWTVGDVLRMQRSYELRAQFERRGIAPQAAADMALREMSRHQPDYRMPLTVLGSPKWADFLAGTGAGGLSRYLTMFNRYHRLVFGSLADMVKNSANFKNPEEMRKAWGHLAVLGVVAFALKPQLDKFAQWVTSNKEAEVRPRGPLAPLQAAYEYARGKKDIGQLASSVLTPAPTARAAADILTNRDWAGRQIISPQARLPQQALQAAHQAATYIAPYGTYGPALQPGSPRAGLAEEIRNQLLDIKAPTARQMAGQRAAQQRAKQEQKSREKRPRGLIEYYGGKMGFARGGVVPPGLARGGPKLRAFAARRFQQQPV